MYIYIFNTYIFNTYIYIYMAHEFNFIFPIILLENTTVLN